MPSKKREDGGGSQEEDCLGFRQAEENVKAILMKRV